METPEEFLKKVLSASCLTSGDGYPGVSIDFEQNAGTTNLIPLIEFKVKKTSIHLFVRDIQGMPIEKIIEEIRRAVKVKQERARADIEASKNFTV